MQPHTSIIDQWQCSKTSVGSAKITNSHWVWWLEIQTFRVHLIWIKEYWHWLDVTIRKQYLNFLLVHSKALINCYFVTLLTTVVSSWLLRKGLSTSAAGPESCCLEHFLIWPWEGATFQTWLPSVPADRTSDLHCQLCFLASGGSWERACGELATCPGWHPWIHPEFTLSQLQETEAVTPWPRAQEQEGREDDWMDEWMVFCLVIMYQSSSFIALPGARV